MSARKWQHWTSDELAILRERFPAEGSEVLAGVLNRTISGVRNKAKELKIRRLPGWTPAMEDRLREAWGKVKTRLLAAEFGKSMLTVKQRAAKLGLDSGKFYTDGEKSMVRDMYATHTAQQISEALYGNNRAVMRVRKLAERLGLRKWPSWPPETVEAVRRLHGERLDDCGIAARIGLTRLQVRAIRRDRLKLPAIKDHIYAHQLQSIRTQMARLGIKAGGALRKLAHQKFARDNGWPEDMRPREVQIMNTLIQFGPQTRWELGERIGWNMDRARHDPRTLLNSNAPEGSYTGTLLARGLILRLPRARNNKDLYLPTAEAVAMAEAHAAARTQGVAS